jgi:hypothetical protein
MTLLAYILLGLAVTGVMFDAWTTHRLIHRPGFREVGIPWRWVPVGLVVPLRVASGLVVLACGLWAIENGVTTGALVAFAVVAALAWGAGLWNRGLD